MLNVPNRSQRAWLTRFRISDVSKLRVEGGRHTQPVTPLENRNCVYCDSTLDDEIDAILLCGAMTLNQNCFLGNMTSMPSTVSNHVSSKYLQTIICPKTSEIAKCVSKYFGIIFDTRQKLDMRLSDDMLGSYTKN